MSSILPFVLVAVSLVVVVRVALAAADQPATDDAPVRRDPLVERLRPLWQWLRRSARESWAWMVATFAGARTRRVEARAARQRQRRARAEAEAVAEIPGTEPAARTTATPVVTPVPERDGVVTTALRVRDDPALGEAAGEDLPRARPGLLVRLKSAIGLIALIGALGLGLAAVLTALVTLVSAALDGFVS